MEKTVTFVFLVLICVTACPPCEKLAKCPESVAECSFGIVNDPCECCPVGRCGLSIGRRCYNTSFSNPDDIKFGLCGPSLYCSVNLFETPLFPEGSCVCKEDQVACGSDNKTYEDICQLNEQANEHDSTLAVQHWGPCLMAPEFVSKPQDTASVIGKPVAIDCEVKGFPTPMVIWEFSGNDGSVKLLPGDDPFVSIQVRGGPESQMSTSWVQISQLRPTDAGLYSCIATNDKGVIRSGARLGISGFQ